MQEWIKKGLVFRPDTSLPWQHSHAAVPTSLHLGGDVFRIFFASRDKNNLTYLGYFDIDILSPEKIIRSSKEPLLTHGTPGMFDDCGVQPSSIINVNGKIYLYYIGWSKGTMKEIFYTSIGLAISEDNGNTFEKYSEAPIMERSIFDPWMVSGPRVILENGAWRMWYISGQKLEVSAEGAKSIYDIRYAESADGIKWKREGTICIPLTAGETNISRITILKNNSGYCCWYPYKKENLGYRIGYAESKDGISWERKDSRAGIDVSASGWDSEAIDKLEIIEHKGTKYMLYNGNQFGLDGIGLAIKDND